jgi:cytidyltransferase-like protein
MSPSGRAGFARAAVGNDRSTRRNSKDSVVTDSSVAIGTFDGVHLGHRRVIQAAKAADLPTTVVTFDPHPRVVLGNQVELLTTLERRMELLDELGVETVVVPFTPELALTTPSRS